MYNINRKYVLFSSRLISTCILAPIIITMILLLTTKQLSVCAFFVCLISAQEWGRIMCFSTYIYKIWMCIIFVALCIIMKVMISSSCVYFNVWGLLKYIFSIIVLWWTIMYFLVLNYPNFIIFWKNYSILRFCFGMLMILPFFWGTLALRQFFCICTNNIVGTWWLFYIVILIWINDSSAYIFGKIFGHRKFLKKVSPKKTWEGLIGGVLMSMIFAFLFIKYSPIIIVKPFFIYICTGSAIFSAIVGDLTESMFKRVAGIKDISNLIPGHGGMLDRIDSLLAAVPIFTCLMLLTHVDIFLIQSI